MSRNSFMLMKPTTAKQAYEYLKDKLRSPKIEGFTYNEATDSVEVVGNYYSYRFMFTANQVNIKPQWSSKWRNIVIVCAVTGFFLLIPFIGAIVIAFLADSEYKEVKTLVQQTLNMMPTEE